LVARYRTTLQEWDLSIQAGKVYGGYQIGTGFSGEIGPVGLRGEASWFQARGDSTILIPDPDSPTDLRSIDLVKNHLSCVVGMDHRFENSLYLNLEYLYNTAGDDDHLFDAVLRSAIGETVSLSEHLTGLQATYDIHPLLTGGISLIYSLSDASSLLSPSIRYSVADESEFLAGALLGFGKRPDLTESSFINPESEFGTYPNIVYAQFKVYF
ncbi:MAG: hypothetical protein RRA35_07510, partial [Desulfomonilia bacterium]|nr:hypothetical protein [Desulfomonilia bacterium]